MNHYSVRLYLKTQSQTHRILWTVSDINEKLPLCPTAAVYEIYKRYISENQAYKFVSDFHDLDGLTSEQIRQMAYAEEYERHFAWNDLAIEHKADGSPIRIQIAAYQLIKSTKFQEYRDEDVADHHIDIN